MSTNSEITGVWVDELDKYPMEIGFIEGFRFIEDPYHPAVQPFKPAIDALKALLIAKHKEKRRFP